MTFDPLFNEFQFGLLGFKIGLLFMEVLLFTTSVFLMLLVLVQRGKGGGLTGALGGMGGQSAFGSKAGDAFTKITVIASVIWITLCMVTIAAFNPPPPPKSLSQQLDAQSGTVTGVGDAGDDASIDATLPGEDDGDSENPTGNSSDGTNDGPTGAASDNGGIELNLDGPTNSPANPGESAPTETTSESGGN